MYTNDILVIGWSRCQDFKCMCLAKRWFPDKMTHVFNLFFRAPYDMYPRVKTPHIFPLFPLNTVDMHVFEYICSEVWSRISGSLHFSGLQAECSWVHCSQLKAWWMIWEGVGSRGVKEGPKRGVSCPDGKAVAGAINTPVPGRSRFFLNLFVINHNQSRWEFVKYEHWVS